MYFFVKNQWQFMSLINMKHKFIISYSLPLVLIYDNGKKNQLPMKFINYFANYIIYFLACT